MEKVEDLVTDKQIDLAWGNANFGNTGLTKRELIANVLLKCASGFVTGHKWKKEKNIYESIEMPRKLGYCFYTLLATVLL